MKYSETGYGALEYPSGAYQNVVVEALAADGWCVSDQLFDPHLIDDLYHEVQRRDDLTPARVGRQQQLRNHPDIRRDKTGWLDGGSAAQLRYLEQMTALRSLLNRRLYLGLQEFEAHFARFDQGDFYRTHVDALAGQRNRVVTSVTYLNPQWQADWGGELVLYDVQGVELKRLLPEAGLTILFLSEEFPHQVLPAVTSRYSIAGWFRVNQDFFR